MQVPAVEEMERMKSRLLARAGPLAGVLRGWCDLMERAIVVLQSLGEHSAE